MELGYVFTDFPLRTKTLEIKYLKSTTFIAVDSDYGPMIFDTGSPYDTGTILSALKTQYHLTPEEVKWVFISHVHPDHVGANRFFRNAKLVISKKDYEFSKGIADTVFNGKNLLKYLHENCPGYLNTFGEFEAENMKRYINENWSFEKLGLDLNPVFIEDDPELPPFIKAVPSFGHTFFHYSYIIENPGLNILFAGDALSMRMVLRDEHEERYAEPHMDFDMYFNSLNELSKFNGLIVPGHDRPFFSDTMKSIRKNRFKLMDAVKYNN